MCGEEALPAKPGDGRAGLGPLAEEIAARHLARLGYRILARNVRTRGGELDIVAVDGLSTVFVEVKSRRGSSSAEAVAEGVSGRKRLALWRAAMAYLRAHHPAGDTRCRFDVVLVRFPAGTGEACVTVIEDAF